MKRRNHATKNDTDRESMCQMNTKFNSNSHRHDKIDDRDCVQLDMQNCHHALRSMILSAGGKIMIYIKRIKLTPLVYIISVPEILRNKGNTKRSTTIIANTNKMIAEVHKLKQKNQSRESLVSIFDEENNICLLQ